MKKSNIIMTSAAALVALIAVTGIALSSFAQDDTSDTTADTPCGSRMHKWQNLSDEEQADLQAQWEAKRAEMEAKKEAIQVALEAGDYQAWVQAVGEDCPMLEKINKDNFSRFVEAHNYMEQGREIFEELGFERHGFGKFGGQMGMHGFGMKLGGFSKTPAE